MTTDRSSGVEIPEAKALALLVGGVLAFERYPACIRFVLAGGRELTYWRDGEYGDSWELVENDVVSPDEPEVKRAKDRAHAYVNRLASNEVEIAQDEERLREALTLLLYYADNGWDTRSGFGEALAEARAVLLEPTVGRTTDTNPSPPQPTSGSSEE